MTFGNYVLFNLLVAILVEGFKCQNDLFVDCYSDDEDAFYTDSDDEEEYYEESPDHDNNSQADEKKGFEGFGLCSFQFNKMFQERRKKGQISFAINAKRKHTSKR